MLFRSNVDVDQLITTLPITDDQRDAFNATLSEKLPDRTFDLDRSLLDARTPRVTYKGDNGLRLSVPEEFYREMVTVEDEPGTDPVIRRVIIKTRQWQRS